MLRDGGECCLCHGECVNWYTNDGTNVAVREAAVRVAQDLCAIASGVGGKTSATWGGRMIWLEQMYNTSNLGSMDNFVLVKSVVEQLDSLLRLDSSTFT